MAEPKGTKPYGARWRPVADLPPEAEEWGLPYYREGVEEWREMDRTLEERKADRWIMDVWMRGRSRAFAITTGEVENLYRLHHGVTEHLMAEGFDEVRGAHSLIGGLDDDTLRGLLEDQEETFQIVSDMARSGEPLTNTAIKALHALLTRHQAHAVGINAKTGERIQIKLLKGQYKVRPNNPRRLDGWVHEYCPPEQVDSEMDQFLAFHRAHADRQLPTEVEAAWLHFEFVRIHPFQDGNGRMSRLLMAYAFIRNKEFPPLIGVENKHGYIDMLEIADDGNLRPFIRHLACIAVMDVHHAVHLGRAILNGRRHYRHGNGGVTLDRVYHPPED